MFRRILFIVVIGVFVLGVSAQMTEFTYQGSLKNTGVPANGNYDFELKLFDAVSAGAQQGSTLQRLNVPIANGIFSVSLDFGAGTLPGAGRFLDIAIRTAGGGAFTPLTPRQQVNSVPYAVRSLNAGTADSVAAGGIPVGSANYIQNTTSLQAASNFNVSGTGTANAFNAGTQYNIGGNRILSNQGSTNLFVGVGAGHANPVGDQNSFFGESAGFSNTAGAGNSFFGRLAGAANTGGYSNSFFGVNAGRSNTMGNQNLFFGAGAGGENTSGSSNLFFGVVAGPFNTTGNENTFFGYFAGSSNTAGTRNTLIGTSTDLGSANLTNATAIGANAAVSQSNSLVLGSINGVNGATADTNVGIGAATPANKLHVNGTIRVTNGAVYITNPNTVIITSPNGACWGITVNNAGGLSTFPVNPCP